MFDLRAKIAIVTGGNGGIGLGMARGLCAAGARVIVAVRNRAKPDRAVGELAALGKGGASSRSFSQARRRTSATGASIPVDGGYAIRG